MIDIRPSIISSNSIPEALVALINPRLSSNLVVNNFKSMKRVIENVTIYYCDMFLNISDRGVMTRDLEQMRKGHVNKMDVLDTKRFFNSPKAVVKYCKYMNLQYYVDNTSKHELARASHTEGDCSEEAIKRVK